MSGVEARQPASVVALVLVVLAVASGLADGAAVGGERPLSQFPGLARVFRDLAGPGLTSPAADAPGEAARLFDFEQVLVAVAGRPEVSGRSLDEYRRAFAGRFPLTIAVDRRVLGRDDTAYRLHSLGYSAREIADVLSGRISRAALDNAQKMLMVGEPPGRVSDFLDREYRRVADARERPRRGTPPPGSGMAAIAAIVQKYAAQHGVDAGLVRAVIAAESGWRSQARSGAGAIGVMQLMPGTARELGVDPFDLEQNIEGGVRYLAWLLRSFGSVERALIAYNAGPGFLQRLIRGEVVLYGETREYVKRVLGAR